ncbi:MAG: phytanoyl-CoA dioxygenase family protein [Proteobacteria bacterium]|nr:phytanoyl-CoA dioxygenase family protein [Pseudomonadota bacterium]
MAVLHRPDPSLAARYARDGVVHVPGILDSGWIARLSAAIDRSMANPAKRAVEFNAEGEPGRFFGDMFMWRRDADFRAAFFETPCAALAGTAMAARQVNLFYDQIFAKEPGTARRTPWHQDFPYWPATGDMFCTVYLALDPIDAENGAVEYVAGSHRWGDDYRPAAFRAGGEGAVRYRDAALAPAPDIDALRGTLDIRSFVLAPGDAVVFHGKLVHGAGGNSSTTRRRRTLALRFAGDDVRWREDVPTFNALAKARLKTGDRLDARPDLFPVLWRQD